MIFYKGQIIDLKGLMKDLRTQNKELQMQIDDLNLKHEKLQQTHEDDAARHQIHVDGLKRENFQLQDQNTKSHERVLISIHFVFISNF